MKVYRVLVLTAATLVILSGCGKQEQDQISEAQSGTESHVEDLASGLQSRVSDLEERLEPGTELSDQDLGDAQRQEQIKKDGEEPNTAAMSRDFSQISMLDATLDNGFPGGPVDEQNRPSGPLGYQEKYGKYDAHFIVPDSNKIYLTFDEGYENGYTARILDILKEKNVKAVFFITYPYAKAEPALVQRMVDEGHTLGNHSTAHKVFPTMTLQDAADDIMQLHDYVKANFGYEMYLFRPPEGAFSEQVLALIQSLGYKAMLWSFAYNDWNVDNQPLSLEATGNIVSKAHPGEICLLHAVSKTNSEILGDVIDQIRGQGFEFSDYFGLTASAPQDDPAATESSVAAE